MFWDSLFDTDLNVWARGTVVQWLVAVYWYTKHTLPYLIIFRLFAAMRQCSITTNSWLMMSQPSLNCAVHYTKKGNPSLTSGFIDYNCDGLGRQNEVSLLQWEICAPFLLYQWETGSGHELGMGHSPSDISSLLALELKKEQQVSLLQNTGA